MMGLTKNMARQVVLVTGISAALFGCDQYKRKIANQSDEIAALTDENAKLKAANQDLEDAKAKLASEKDVSESSRSELEAKVAELEEQIKAQEAELESLGLRKTELSKDLEDKDAALKELRRQQMLVKKRLATLKNILRKFKKLIAAGKLDVKIRRGKMVLELPSAVLFESGKASLSEDGKETLKEVAKVLSKIRQQEFQVSGHTDTVPIKTAGYPSNWELSTARAVTVVKFLQDANVSPKELSAAGYSQYQPAAPNTTEKGKAANRRIEIVLMPNMSELPDLSDLEKELKK